MMIGVTQKLPAEVITLSVDFGPWLGSSETVQTRTVRAINELTGQDSSAVILSGAPSGTGSVVSQKVIAGVSRDRHLLTYEITTSSGHTYDAQLRLLIE